MKHNKGWIVWLLLLEKLIISSQFVNKTSKSSNWHSEPTTTTVFHFHILQYIIPPKHLLQIQLAFMVLVCVWVRVASASCHPSFYMHLRGDWTNESWRGNRVSIDWLRSGHHATVSRTTTQFFGRRESPSHDIRLKPLNNNFFFLYLLLFPHNPSLSVPSPCFPPLVCIVCSRLWRMIDRPQSFQRSYQFSKHVLEMQPH